MIKQILSSITVILLIGLLACQKTESPSPSPSLSASGSPELMLFSDTIDWGWELGEFYGGNSFYWWNNTAEGVVNLGDMPVDCWKNPYDFENGNFYLRFEILEQPSDQAFFIQLGIWQNIGAEGGYSETVSGRFLLENGAGTLEEIDLDSPSTWWELKDDKPVDFCKPGNFDRIGLVLWKAEPRCLPMGQGWNNSQACANPEQTALEFFPLKARVSVVAVAAGHSFSGWQNHP